MKDLQSIFYCPDDLREAFYGIAAKKNHYILLILSIISIVVEALNILVTVFATENGLRDASGKFHFVAYFCLFVIGILYLVSRKWLSKFKKASFHVDSVYISLFLFWQIGVTILNARLFGIAEISTIVISVMVFGTLFLHMPHYMIPHVLLSYVLIVLGTFEYQTLYGLINVTIASVFACVTSVNRYLNFIEVLNQKFHVEDANNILKSDIVAQRELIDELKNEIQKDPLTKVLNKSAIEQKIARYIQGEERGQHSVLILADFYRFKRINDKFGHPCGDYVLKEFAYILEEAFRDWDPWIGRIGGDEFLLFIREIDEIELYRACDKVHAHMQSVTWKGIFLNSRVSIGAVSAKPDETDYFELYGKVDKAMYTAKNSGEDSFFDL